MFAHDRLCTAKDPAFSFWAVIEAEGFAFETRCFAAWDPTARARARAQARAQALRLGRMGVLLKGVRDAGRAVLGDAETTEDGTGFGFARKGRHFGEPPMLGRRGRSKGIKKYTNGRQLMYVMSDHDFVTSVEGTGQIGK